MSNFYGQYIGFGAGGVAVAYIYGGTQYGYTCGGRATNTDVDRIDRYSFTSDAPAADVGNLTTTRTFGTGHHSKENGYHTGGGPGGGFSNILQKFSFATDSEDAAAYGDLTIQRGGSAGNSSADYGYASCGCTNPSAIPVKSIDKFSFAADTNAEGIGDATIERQACGESSSATHGYTHGGHGGAPSYTRLDTIDRLAVASDTTGLDVGDMGRGGDTALAGCSSAENGYVVGGHTDDAPPLYDVGKYNFASGGGSTDIIDLTNDTFRYPSASSSLTYGYRAGGGQQPDTAIIDNFPFASDTNASGVGDLTSARRYICGQSY